MIVWAHCGTGNDLCSGSHLESESVFLPKNYPYLDEQRTQQVAPRKPRTVRSWWKPRWNAYFLPFLSLFCIQSSDALFLANIISWGIRSHSLHILLITKSPTQKLRDKDWPPGGKAGVQNPEVWGLGEEWDEAAEGDDGQEHEGGDPDTRHTRWAASEQGRWKLFCMHRKVPGILCYAGKHRECRSFWPTQPATW